MEGRFWRVVRRRSDDGDDTCRDVVLGRCQHRRLTSVMVAMRPRAGTEVTSDIKGAMVFIVASRMVPEVAVLFLIPVPVGLAVSWGA